MAQANIKTITRRLALIGIAVPALAVPALANVGRPTGDAELLALAPQLEAVIAERAARMALDQARDERYEAACQAAGLPRIEHPKWTETPDWDTAHQSWLAYNARRETVRAAIIDLDPAWAAEDQVERNDGPSFWDTFNDRQFAIIDTIMAYQPVTVTGLAVVARAASLLSESTVGGDLSHSEYEALVQVILDFTGTDPVTD